MAIVIKEIEVKTTVEQNRADMDAEREALKRRIQEEVQQEVEQLMKADMERLQREFPMPTER